MNRLEQKDLWTLRALVQKAGWKEFMIHVGSLMAEQADKVKRDSKEDKALFGMSTFLHNPGVVAMVEECGSFDYRPFIQMGWVPEEFRQLLLDNPPPEKETTCDTTNTPSSTEAPSANG